MGIPVKPTMMGKFTLLMALIMGLSLLTVEQPRLVIQIYAQNENETSEISKIFKFY
jgi:hypothetical protein